MNETAQVSPLDMVCKNCKQVLKGLILLALFEEAGCKVYPSSTECAPGQKHQFEKAA